MRRFLPVMMLAAAAIAMSHPPAFGKGGGGSSQASPPAHSAAAVNSNGNFATDRDFGQDRAEDRRHDGSTNANSNGKNAADRDFGRDRAEDRMSAEGKAHAKAAKNKKQKVAQSSTSQR